MRILVNGDLDQQRSRHGDCARCGFRCQEWTSRARARTHIHNRKRCSSSSSVLSGLVTSCCDSLRRFARWYHENLGGDGCSDGRFYRCMPEILCRYDCAGIQRLRWGRREICHASRFLWWCTARFSADRALTVLCHFSRKQFVYVANQFR